MSFISFLPHQFVAQRAIMNFELRFSFRTRIRLHAATHAAAMPHTAAYAAACPPAPALPCSAATCLRFQQEQRDSHIFATLFKNGLYYCNTMYYIAAEKSSLKECNTEP